LDVRTLKKKGKYFHYVLQDTGEIFIKPALLFRIIPLIFIVILLVYLLFLFISRDVSLRLHYLA